MSVIAGSAAIAGINFGDNSNVNAGTLRFDNATDQFYFSVNLVEKLRITSVGLDIPEVTPSGNPAADTLRLYVSAADGKLYYRDSAGTDVEIGAAGSVGADTIGTSELDDASDTPVENYLAAVDSATTGFQYIQVGTGLSVSGSEYARTLAIAATTVDTTSAQTLEAKTLTDPSLGDDSALTQRKPNDASVGTFANRLAKIQADGGAEEAVIITTSDTGIPVFVVYTGAGTTGNVELAIAGEVQADADGACAVRDNVIASTGTAGEVSCTATPLAQDVFCVGVATQAIGAAGLVDVQIGDGLCTRQAGDALVIASGTAALGTSAITSGACATVVTASATGVVTTDSITWTPNADITGVTGYVPSTSGGLSIYPYPSADNVNFKVCNPTAGSITPGAVTLNWQVVR